MNINKIIKTYIKQNKVINNDIFKFIEDNINKIIDLEIDIKLLAVIINHAKYKYFNGEEILSDYAYDKLLDKLTKQDKSNKILSEIGYKINGINKIKLPYHMGSMNKIKILEPDKLNKWIDNFSGPYLISNKLDGVSCMLEINKDGVMKLYTRGDGDIGSDISHLIRYININNIKNIEQYNKNNKKIVLRGEIIISNKKFYKKYKEISVNGRNFVAGQVNSKKLNEEILKDIDIIFYEIIEPSMRIIEQFDLMTRLDISISPFEVISHDNLSFENLSNKLKKNKEISEYDIDGLIISDINIHNRNTDGNPEYSFAFKETLESDIITATVEYVEYNVSKDGYLKPRIKIFPIILSGVTIYYATAHNAKFIVDNKIGPNTIIKITRSGDVIPYIVKIIKSSKIGQLPLESMHGNWKWNESGVDIILSSADIQNDQLIKILSFFTKNLKIKNIDDATFKILVENKIINKLSDIFYLKYKDIIKLQGFQEKKTNKILNELTFGFNNMKLFELMIASNIFGHGIGPKKIKKIIMKYPDIILQRYKSKEILIDLIDNIYGFDKITATQFVSKLDKFNDFLQEIPTKIKNKLILEMIPNKINNSIELKLTNSLSINENTTNLILDDLTFVFTGFRNNLWENLIEKNGGKISNSVSKNTTLVVYNNLNENSNKIIKANNLKIKLLQINQFIDYIKYNYNITLQ